MKKILIISPHLDDAVLSCGDLIHKLNSEGNIIDVVTVFSKDASDLSSSAIRFHYNCFLPNMPMKHRKIEDKKAHKLLNCGSIYLNLLECLYRKNNNEFLYPDLDNIYHLEKKDTKIIKTVEEKLLKIVNNYDIVLCPMGLGGHADHLVCNKAVNNIKKQINGKLFFYEEVAYVCYYYREHIKSNWGDGLSYKLIELSEDDFNSKINGILLYRSQLNILWSNYEQMYNDLDIFSRKYSNNRSIRLWYYESI